MLYRIIQCISFYFFTVCLPVCLYFFYVSARIFFTCLSIYLPTIHVCDIWKQYQRIVSVYFYFNTIFKLICTLLFFVDRPKETAAVELPNSGMLPLMQNYCSLSTILYSRHSSLQHCLYLINMSTIDYLKISFFHFPHLSSSSFYCMFYSLTLSIAF